MGQLLRLENFSRKRGENKLLDPFWYFTDTSYGAYDHIIFDVSVTFPFPAYIHVDDTGRYKEDQNKLRIKIRNFVERSCSGNVVFLIKDRSYRRYYDPLHSDKYHEVTHAYWVFNFEEQNDQVLFALKFSEVITREPSDDHPDYPRKNEEK